MNNDYYSYKVIQILCQIVPINEKNPNLRSQFIKMQEYLILAPASSYLFIITVLTSLYAFYFDDSIINKFILAPYQMVKHNEYYRILTCSLIHADWWHLIFNMYSFYIFAFTLEIHFLGTIYFLIVYVGSLIVSCLPSVIQHKNNPAYLSLGASGAVSGIVFSYVLFNPFQLFYVFFAIPMPAWLFGIIFTVYSYFAAKNSADNINHNAHLWGALTGLILTLILNPHILRRYF